MAKDIKEDMNIVVVGHVDHGKSTIIGRLLSDTNSLPKGKLESIKEKCKRNSKPFEYAFLLDALKDEQSQGITIDSARCFFKTKKRNYMIIDAPGHIEFLKNMITGASRAEAALLVIDAFEGIRENSKRHGYMLSMLGIKQIAVLINKMDLINYDEIVYKNLVKDYSEFLKQIGIENFIFIPVSGRCGDNLINLSNNMKWYNRNTVIQVLDGFIKENLPENKPFRMHVQDVYKFTERGDTRRIIAGTVETGKLSVGDEVVFYPSCKRSVVDSIEVFNAEPKESVFAKEAIGFTLREQIYVKRGEIAVKASDPKPIVSSRIIANIFWLGKNPMEKSKDYYLKIGTSKVRVKLSNVLNVLDTSDLKKVKKDKIGTYDVAECEIESNRNIAFDLCSENLSTSRFIIVDDYEISGGGIIIKSPGKNWDLIKEKPFIKKYNFKYADTNIVWQNGNISYEDRCRTLNQPGIVVWFTGLSGAGKSTIAAEVEKELIKRNKAVYRLDGDNVRHGLNSDLSFTETDRNENIRRIAEVAFLFKDAALITLVAAISPYAFMRNFAREKIGSENFIEVYVKADIEECMRRDPKGFYKKAKEGKIDGYTGISDPYEIPQNPELILDTMKFSVDECVKLVMNTVNKTILKNYHHN
ncbi:adenylyl-sulfate kinase [Clostridium sp. AWRP]|uniref:adenylyl-sulfate kinase n=1 Tax=Clostridium sp. AWRP TaxID=2212991 RepID=UPI000FD9A863|nr:adenylyl-sulfate kinase [Clostridium sp. AWRP]AZV59054.1 adenylyl-sulfate kinase [Clostridium sp. AWRP]